MVKIDSMSHFGSFTMLVVTVLLLLTTSLWGASKGIAVIETLQAGELTKARTLIGSGADPNGEDENGRTVLSWAAEKGNAEIIDLLIKKGARVNQRDQQGRTALMYAAIQGNGAIIKSLLKGKADVNIIDEQGRTALMKAAAAGSSEGVRTLLAAGAKSSATDYEGRTTADLAAGDQRHQILQILGGKSPEKKTTNTVEDKPQQPKTTTVETPTTEQKPGPPAPEATAVKADPLIEAAKEGDTERVRSMILSGANVNQRMEPDGDTALMWAALKGHAQIVQILMVAGSDPNTQTESGLTALMAASLQGHKEIVQSLLKGGAEINTKRKDGATALALAEKAGHRDIADLLRKAGARNE